MNLVTDGLYKGLIDFCMDIKTKEFGEMLKSLKCRQPENDDVVELCAH